MKEKKYILIIDENYAFSMDAIAVISKNYNFKLIHSIEEGSTLGDLSKADLIILTSQNKLESLQFIHKIKNTRHNKPCSIIFQALTEDEYFEADAFDAGVDGFIVGPVKIRALAKRIENLLESYKEELIKIGKLIVNPHSFSVSIGNEKISFTKKEFELFLIMVKNPNKVFKRQELLDMIWENDKLMNDRTIDVHINRIRDKIGRDYIETIIRVGYKFINVPVHESMKLMLYFFISKFDFLNTLFLTRLDVFINPSNVPMG